MVHSQPGSTPASPRDKEVKVEKIEINYNNVYGLPMAYKIALHVKPHYSQ
jgi:hypothetical protein